MGHFVVWTKHQNGASGGLASLPGSAPGLPGRLKASSNRHCSSVLTLEGLGRPKVGRGRARGGSRNDMPPTGHFASFHWNQMAASRAKLDGQISLKLRIQTKTELSILLVVEVLKIHRIVQELQPPKVRKCVLSNVDHFRGL